VGWKLQIPGSGGISPRFREKARTAQLPTVFDNFRLGPSIDEKGKMSATRLIRAK
jgi:hypothetical protein